MKRSSIGLALGALVTIGTLVSLPSCGHDQKLVSIAIQPANATFLDPDPALTVQYTAIATYIHPPATKDVTNQATWAVDDNIVTIKAGLVSPANGDCGTGNISASLGGASNIVIGYALVTVNNAAVPTCPH